jgi:hypothetical protein
MGTKPKDAALTAAQREFMDDTTPEWELKPNEQACTDCWLVHAGECW